MFSSFYIFTVSILYFIWFLNNQDSFLLSVLSNSQQRSMISCHTNKNKNNIPWVNGVRPSMYGSILHQKSIKKYLEPQTNLTKKPQENLNIQKDQRPKVQKYNDENCSFNANKIEIEAKTQNKAELLRQKGQIHDFVEEEEMKQSKSRQVVNLKKKIKKCSSKQMNRGQSYFRERVSFMRKFFLTRQQQHEDLEGTLNGIKGSDKIQTYPVYRDSEVFYGYRNVELRNQIVIQRMDNDGETDEEEIQKFVNKIKTQFLTQLQKVQKQKNEQKNNKPIQEMNLGDFSQLGQK